MDPQQLQARRLLFVQYACRLPPRSRAFRWPSGILLLAIQSAVFEDTALEPAPVSYEKVFLKEIIARIEDAARLSPSDDDSETDSNLVERYAELLALPTSSDAIKPDSWDRIDSSIPFRNHAPPAKQHLAYYFPSGDLSSATRFSQNEALLQGWEKIRLHEASSSLVSSGSTACKTWEASLRLASHLLADPQRSELCGPGAQVLELGCGTGLLSAMVAMLQQKFRRQNTQYATGEDRPRIYATDLPTVTQTRLRSTLSLNSQNLTEEVDIFVRDLDWVQMHEAIQDDSEDAEESEHVDIFAEIAPTLVLGADIIFDPDLCPPLAAVIRRALAAGARKTQDTPPEAIISSTVRSVATYSRFLACLDEVGLVSEHIDLRRAEYSVDEIPQELVLRPFPSGHDEATEGVVKGLRIRLPSGKVNAEPLPTRTA
ncbi:unnamed protein product [Parajaminaea phylloscopi]